MAQLTPEEEKFVQRLSPDAQEAMELVPDATMHLMRHMPSPLVPSIVIGLIGAGIGHLADKKALKWGAITGALTFGAMTLAETAFVGGVSVAVVAMAQEQRRRIIAMQAQAAVPNWDYPEY
jgi:hypothetical protein